MLARGLKFSYSIRRYYFILAANNDGSDETTREHAHTLLFAYGINTCNNDTAHIKTSHSKAMHCTFSLFFLLTSMGKYSAKRLFLLPTFLCVYA